MTIEEDPIVAEVREARRRIAVFYGNDIRRIAMATRQSFAEMGGRNRRACRSGRGC